MPKKYEFSSTSREQIYEAMKQLDILHQNGTTITVSCLNVILSCFAERGESDSAFHVLLNEFDKYDAIQPNADSYSFALESLGKHVLRSMRYSSGSDTKAHCIRRAEQLLNLMDQQNVIPTQHVIYEYVELLCQADQVETATDVVLDTYREYGYVQSKIIYRVATANSKIGNHRMAYEIASLSDMDMPILFQNIKDNERIEEQKRNEFPIRPKKKRS
jgi:hypothetical protein